MADHDSITQAAAKLRETGILPSGAYEKLKSTQKGTELLLARNASKLGLELNEAVGMGKIAWMAAGTMHGIAKGGILGGIWGLGTSFLSSGLLGNFIGKRVLDTTEAFSLFINQWNALMFSTAHSMDVKRSDFCTKERTYFGRGIITPLSSLMPAATVHSEDDDLIRIKPCGQLLVRNEKGQTVGEQNPRRETIRHHVGFRCPLEWFFALKDTVKWKPMTNQEFLDLLTKADIPFVKKLTSYPRPPHFSVAFAKTGPSKLEKASRETVEAFTDIYELNSYLFRQKKFYWEQHCCMFGKSGDEDEFMGTGHGTGVIKYTDLPEDARHQNLVRKANGDLAVVVPDENRVVKAYDVVCAVPSTELDEMTLGGPGTTVFLASGVVGALSFKAVRRLVADGASVAVMVLPPHLQYLTGMIDADSLLDYYEAGGRNAISVDSQVLVSVGETDIVFPNPSCKMALNVLGSRDAGRMTALLSRCGAGMPKAMCLVSVLATVEWKGDETFNKLKSKYKARLLMRASPLVKVAVLGGATSSRMENSLCQSSDGQVGSTQKNKISKLLLK